MKPHVICHMIASVDGRTLLSRWQPDDVRQRGLFEQLHEVLAGDAWLVGRVTGGEYAKLSAYPDDVDHRYPMEHWFARRNAPAYGVVLDAQGKIAWGRSDIGGDPIIAMLSRRVSVAHLAGLRDDEVSYIFAGDHELDLGLTLEILNQELGIKRLVLEGGGLTNGAFLRAGLLDELSLAIFPAVDGTKGAPCVFDSRENEIGAPAQLCSMTLESSEMLEGGVVWLRYKLQSK